MSMICFKLRKYDHTIDASFFLMDGRDVYNASDWLVGDSVSVMFEATDEIKEALDDQGFDDVRVCDNYIHVPCTVIKRRHACSWKAVGELQLLTKCSITLQADSGHWEDVLEWITTGKKPVCAAD